MPRTLSEQEFKAIEDAVIRSAPADLQEADFDRWVGPRIDGAVAQAENSNAPVSGSALRRFVGGAAAMLNPWTAAMGIGNAVAHPINTVSGAVKDMGQQWSQASDLWSQGRVSEAIGHGLAGSVPLVGPAAGRAGDQMGSGDVVGGLGAATGLLVPTVGPMMMRGAARLLPESLAANAERGAASRVADVMSPKVGANKQRFGNQAEKIAPQLAKDLVTDGAPLTRDGLHASVEGKLAQAERGLDAAADARDPLATYNTAPIIRDLETKYRQLVAEGDNGMRRNPSSGRVIGTPVTTTSQDVLPTPNAGRAAVIRQAIDELKALGPTARYESLRRIRQAYDGPAKAVYSPSMTADYLKAQGGKLGAADVTGSLRESLAKFDPGSAEANAEYSTYRTANDVLEATREIERTRPRVGRIIAGRIFGTMVGERAGGIPGAVAGYAAAPILDAASQAGFTTKLKIAQLQMRLADAIRAGDVGLVTGMVNELKSLAKEGAKASRLVITGVQPSAATADETQDSTLPSRARR